MRKAFPFFLIPILSCGGDLGGSASDTDAGPHDGPADDGSSGGDAGTADPCEGITGTPGTPALTKQLVVDGFDRPVGVTAPTGDARLFVIEQSTGLIRIVRDGTIETTPFLDLGGLIADGGGEQGLLGLAFHPAYATNGLFYVNYTDTSGDTQVSEYKASSDPDVADPGSARSILSIPDDPYPNHNGGNLAFGPDSYLYIGTGDGGSGGDPEERAQNLASVYGKMLRVDVAGDPYSIPADNPFVGMGGAREEIWAYGLRNPWRYAFDRVTGDLYIGDVGQDDWEEVDVQPAASAGGENYGWDIVEGKDGPDYNPDTNDTTGVTPPVYDYSHEGGGASITGGFVYRGCELPGYQGTYFFAEIIGHWVRSFRWDGGAGITDLTEQDGLSGGATSSFGEGGDGELYFVDLSSGELFKIVAE